MLNGPLRSSENSSRLDGVKVFWCMPTFQLPLCGAMPKAVLVTRSNSLDVPNAVAFATVEVKRALDMLNNVPPAVLFSKSPFKSRLADAGALTANAVAAVSAARIVDAFMVIPFQFEIAYTHKL